MESGNGDTEIPIGELLVIRPVVPRVAVLSLQSTNDYSKRFDFDSDVDFDLHFDYNLDLNFQTARRLSLSVLFNYIYYRQLVQRSM